MAWGVVRDLGATQLPEPHHVAELSAAVVFHAANVRVLEVQATMNRSLLDVKA